MFYYLQERCVKEYFTFKFQDVIKDSSIFCADSESDNDLEWSDWPEELDEDLHWSDWD